MANALQQLIREHLDRKGWSYGDVARRGGIPRSTVHHLATTDRVVRMPQATTLEGLAKGLELPLEAVRRAAAEACGIHVYDTSPAADPNGTAAADPEVALLIASVQQLSADDRRHVTALVESLLDRSSRPAGPSRSAEEK
ncbi:MULTISPECIES: helix-turn-helix domain-containing protein [Streptomyces]|uniref:helix-turn-helix domain-containing protein n=1 Tax=Streptomyces TaxID=1883 RepID=UPI000B5C9616|nr:MULTISPECIES: helix-turn-helix transcriptional regulator [Streptomyces]